MQNRSVVIGVSAIKQKGIDDNTIIVFTTDHGEMAGSHKLIAKTTFYEESSKIPIIIKYPKIIKEVRGKGLLIGLCLHVNQAKFIQKLLDNNLLTVRAAENVVRLLPPLNVTKSEINIGLKIIEKVCKNFK